MSDALGAVRAWLADEVDERDARELTSLLASAEHGDERAEAQLADRFAGTLTFGTAGLRGALRAGPNGMNTVVVRRAAAGIASWLAARGDGGRVVVVGCDARHRSAEFAHDSAAIFGAAGFEAVLLPPRLPTPVLAFAVQHLGAAAGVMVTASHNPKQDNGHKVYAGDGAQIAPPTDREIEGSIRAVGATRMIPLERARVRQAGSEIVAAYVAAVAGLLRPGPREVKVVHTAMHGVGDGVVREAFAHAGFPPPVAVTPQQQPDPDFPTVSFPNPEEPGALDLALETAAREQADLVIANDPDADRCAVAVPDRDGPTGSTGSRAANSWRVLRGDDLGVLLADALMRRGVTGSYATTIVSSSMLRALCEKRGVPYAETLTGFKWISRAAPDLVYGYEEALGYAVAPNLVRDKDGISAALLVAEIAAELKSRGSTLIERLDELADEVGRFVTDQVSLRVGDLSEITAVMARLRRRPPTTLLGATVTVEDLLPDADVIRLRVPDARVVIRPSGTEPKLKAYLEVVDPSGSPAGAPARLAQLREEVAALLR